MSDLISRQAAIDAISDCGICLQKIIDLPSAQPKSENEPSKTVHFVPNEDFISRKTAIDALFELYEYQRDIDPTEAADLVRQGIFLAEKKIEKLPSAQPEHTNSWCINSWCIDCKEYDTENKCCPRYNRVIKQTLDEVYAHAETEAEARFHAQQRWIPCSERLPAYGEDVLISIGGYCNVGYIVSVNEEEQYNWYFSGWYHLPNDVDAWMPLPEPYAERRTDDLQ